MPPPRVAAVALALAASACGGGSFPAGHSGPPSGWLTYQSISGSDFALRVVRLDGREDQPLQGRAAQVAFGPSFSAAAGQIAFTSSKDGVLSLVLHAWADDSERVLDVGTLWPAVPAISPDGKTIVFEGTEGGAPSDLFLLPIGGGTPAPLAADPANDVGPTWSADGLSVFFASNRTGQWEVYRVGADGTGLTQVTTGSRLIGRLAVSADGATISFARDDDHQIPHVVLHSLADAAERVLFADSAEWDPAFDATGTRIAVVSRVFGDPEIVIRDVATGALIQRLAHQDGLEVSPAFAR